MGLVCNHLRDTSSALIPVQVKQQAVVGGEPGYIADGCTVYDTKGRVHQKGKPYFTPNNGFNPKENVREPVRYDYDAQNRVKTETFADGTKIGYEYDGLVTRTTDQLGVVKRTETDALGRVAKITDNATAKGGAPAVTIAYSYNAFDLITGVTVDNVAQVTVRYDVLGRKTGVHDPSLGEYTYVWNNATSQIGKAIDPAGNTATYTYGQAGWLTGMIVRDTSGLVQREASFSYGTAAADKEKGRLIQIREQFRVRSGGSGETEELTTAFKYDAIGNVIREEATIDGKTFTTEKTWDWFGKALSITTPDGLTVQYGYDAAGQLVHAGTPQNPQAFVREIVYTQDGRRQSITYGNGVKTEYAYDPVRGAIADIRTANASGTILQHQAYVFDAAGNILSIQHEHGGPTGGGITRYAYDGLGRLQSDKATGYNEPVLDGDTTYAWTPRGNILSKTGIGNYHWNESSGKLGSISDPSSGRTLRSYEWDTRGNMASRTTNVSHGDRQHQHRMEFTFSADNRLVNATNAHSYDEGGLSVDFAYDHTGRRIRKISSLGNRFLYINATYAEKFYADDSVNIRTTHVYAGRERVATLVDGEAHFIHRDHINTGGTITADGGEVKDRIAFTSHGKIKYQLAASGSAREIEEKFTGQTFDPETGLYYYNARYYDPEVGIFVSPDTMVPDGYDSQNFNRYMYCVGNPIKYNDPTGHYLEYDGSYYSNEKERALGLMRLLDSIREVIRDRGSIRTEYVEGNGDRVRIFIDPSGIEGYGSSAAVSEYNRISYSENNTVTVFDRPKEGWNWDKETNKENSWASASGVQSPATTRFGRWSTPEDRSPRSPDFSVWIDLQSENFEDPINRGRAGFSGDTAGIVLLHEVAEAFAGRSGAEFDRSHRHALKIENKAREQLGYGNMRK